jgi:ATP-binding cassette subfamily B protein
MAFEKGYDTLVGERGVTLSGGQKATPDHCANADSRMPDPRFRRLAERGRTHEPISRSEVSCWHVVAKATTLIVSHRIATLAHADRILVLENGRITAEGTHEDLIQEPGLYQRVFAIQSSLEDELGGGEST